MAHEVVLLAVPNSKDNWLRVIARQWRDEDPGRRPVWQDADVLRLGPATDQDGPLLRTQPMFTSRSGIEPVMARAAARG